MAHYLDIFSPETYETFSNSDGNVSGFSVKYQSAADKVNVGDKFICYVTRISCWVGILEVTSRSYEDNSPIYSANDPFVIRFKVKRLVWLELKCAVPIQTDRVWKTLSFTKDHDKKSTTWTAPLRVALSRLKENDGTFLEQLLLEQARQKEDFSIEESNQLNTYEIKRDDNVHTVVVPDDSDVEADSLVPAAEVRESIRIQALLATIGARMGMSIWVPRNDRAAVTSQWSGDKNKMLTELPLHYKSVVLSTIEQIDVLWLDRTTIVRAFEVEHTTAIYSGILRMADLLSLEPNINIKLHIVAPLKRRDKVLDNINRPAFSEGEVRLPEVCTYLSYESVEELAQQKHLEDMRASVVDRYSEQRKDSEK